MSIWASAEWDYAGFLQPTEILTLESVIRVDMPELPATSKQNQNGASLRSLLTLGREFKDI